MSADFLWPHEDGSLAMHAYELVNGFHEDYKKLHWEEILKIFKGMEDRACRLEKACEKMVCVVNRVTANHRHGRPVLPEHIDRLSNYQIEFEKILYGVEEISK